MLSSLAFHKPHSFILVAIWFLTLATTGCSSVGGGLKETVAHDKVNACDSSQLTEHEALSCNLKTIQQLAELGESSKYHTYLNTEVGNPLNLLLFSYDKTVKELVELTSSLLNFGSEDKEASESGDESNSLATTTNDYGQVEVDAQGHRQHFARSKTVLSQAYRFLGVPYRRGGTSPKGFDCSGLVYYLHKNIGISLPRTAHAQYLNSSPIAQSDLQAGDLVFFRTHRGTRRITHVGVYVGDNKFIHSRSPGKRVTITSLSDSYYRSRFVRGGRI